MSLLDWLIVIIPVTFVLGMGIYSRKYVRGVADFLSAGRICGRYVISVADIACGLAIITLVAQVEVNYKTGFALSFWQSIIMPLSIIMGLTGFCTYRFRETKAMSLGQFLEMRYSRSFRIFAAALRSVSEALANMIMPAIAARFFIYLLDLPHHFQLFGLTIPTFMVIVVLVLFMAILIICMGGTLALVITDSIQGMICYPLMVLFTVYILYRYSWAEEIVPVMMDRGPGESFLNPYDIENLRDFNIFFLIVTVMATILHRASWIGAGYSTAARTPHEQKMAGLLGAWRGALNGVFYVLIAITVLTVMNHRDFAADSHAIRVKLADRISGELVTDQKIQKKLVRELNALPIQEHIIGKDAPLTDKKNLDTQYLKTAHQVLLTAMPEGKDPAKLTAKEKSDIEGENNAKFQQFRTLYYQMSVATSMRSILPMGLIGLFCLLMILAMISTDDTRIFSAALTIAQDVIMPVRKKPFTPKQHLNVLRWTSIGIGVFFFFGSFFMAQLDYINLFVTIVCTMWMGGCGPVMIFGLYSRFGTTAGAWTSLLTGMFVSIGSILIQRNWADLVYPFLEQHGWVDGVGNFLATCSKPLNPYVVWEMNPVKCPINSYEFYFMTMVLTLILYCVVSWATCKEPFNLDQMLHRGIYDIDGEHKAPEPWSWRNIFNKLISITPEYTFWDKVIAWAFFIYSFVYRFLMVFLLVVVWNAFSPWPIEWWGHYFLIVTLIVPCIVAFISTFWFGIGGIVDLIRLFRDLEHRTVNELDDGRVEGNISLADKAKMEALAQKQAEAENPEK